MCGHAKFYTLSATRAGLILSPCTFLSKNIVCRALCRLVTNCRESGDALELGAAAIVLVRLLFYTIDRHRSGAIYRRLAPRFYRVIRFYRRLKGSRRLRSGERRIKDITHNSILFQSSLKLRREAQQTPLYIRTDPVLTKLQLQ